MDDINNSNMFDYILLTAEYDSVWKSSKLFTFGVPKSDQKGDKKCLFFRSGFGVKERRLRERVKRVINYQC